MPIGAATEWAGLVGKGAIWLKILVAEGVSKTQRTLAMWNTFRDRIEAGRLLATHLTEYADREDVVVLALPRGGVPVGFEVAQRLHAPFDVVVVRKLGAPGHEELALGAIASGGARVLNADIIAALGVKEDAIEQVTVQEQAELRRRESAYRRNKPAPLVESKTVILVDDGIATGATMRAAARSIAARHPTRLIIAVPTAPPDVYDDFAGEADGVVAFMTPDPFRAVGIWYDAFPQVSDVEVIQLLSEARPAELIREARRLQRSA
jgi:putative phosphoribosyl transferase